MRDRPEFSRRNLELDFATGTNYRLNTQQSAGFEDPRAGGSIDPNLSFAQEDLWASQNRLLISSEPLQQEGRQLLLSDYQPHLAGLQRQGGLPIARQLLGAVFGGHNRLRRRLGSSDVNLAGHASHDERDG